MENSEESETTINILHHYDDTNNISTLNSINDNNNNNSTLNNTDNNIESDDTINNDISDNNIKNINLDDSNKISDNDTDKLLSEIENESNLNDSLDRTLSESQAYKKTSQEIEEEDESMESYRDKLIPPEAVYSIADYTQYDNTSSKNAIKGAKLDIIELCYSVVINNKLKKILKNVSFSLEPGTMCALMGPSNAGKR